MKILLDESLPRKLKNDFGTDHEVYTVRDRGWLGTKNGALPALMVGAGFEVFITVDRNLPSQQNLGKLPLTVFVPRAIDNRRETLARLAPRLLNYLASGNNLPQVIEVGDQD
jgi:hypothetical protein